MYRVGYRTASFGKLSLADTFRALGPMGYDSLELCLEREDLDPLRLTPRKAAEVLEAAQRWGLDLHSLSYHGDRVEWQGRAARQTAAVRGAPWFGVDTVVLNTPPPSPEADAAEVTAHLCDVARAAEEIGVVVAMEPEPGLLVADVTDALKLLADCPAHSLAVNLDVGHAFLTEPDLGAAIRALEGVIAHTHFEDMPLGEHRHQLPGQGDMDLKGVVLDLWRAGFRGVLTLDLFGPFDDPVQVARQALRATRDLLREAIRDVRAGF